MRIVRHAGALAVLAFMLAILPASAQARTCTEYGETCETAKEHAEFQAFAACPFTAAEEVICSWAGSTYHEVWPTKTAKEEFEKERERTAPNLPSEFTAGKVTVQLKSPITLQGGITSNEEGDVWLPAEGAPTIAPVAEKAAALQKDVDTALLSEAELSRFDYYVKTAKETATSATVELAGPATSITVNVDNLLEEEGTAFSFPVKVHLQNAFLGEDCYVGSNEDPIVVEFTTGVSGELRGKNGSKLEANKAGSILSLLTDTLVSTTFASPGVEGCGVDGGADAAIDAGLGLPSASGNSSVLNGTLKLAAGSEAKEGLEGKI